MRKFELNETILSQYANSPIILKLIESFNQNIGPENNIIDFYNFVFNVETAQGFGLDIWGRIVGVNRFLEVVPSGEFFGFYNPSFSQAEQVYTPFNVKPFFNGFDVTPIVPINDTDYRKMIYAKAYANINPCTVPTFNAMLDIILGPGRGYTIDNLNMTMAFAFNDQISDVEYAIIYNSGIMPIPDGVKLLID